MGLINKQVNLAKVSEMTAAAMREASLTGRDHAKAGTPEQRAAAAKATAEARAGATPEEEAAVRQSLANLDDLNRGRRIWG